MQYGSAEPCGLNCAVPLLAYERSSYERGRGILYLCANIIYRVLWPLKQITAKGIREMKCIVCGGYAVKKPREDIKKQRNGVF